MKFFSALAQYRHMGKAKNFLYTIAAHLCADGAVTSPEVSLEELPEGGIASNQDDRLLLEIAVGHLPGELREVIALHYYQGLKLSEVAAVLQIGLPLVKYRLKRAKELLRKELSYEPQF